MVLQLDTLPRKSLTIFLVSALVAAASFYLWRQQRADALQRQGTRESMEQALELQPRNAEFHNRLGRILLYSPGDNAERAQLLLTRATQLNGRRASFWLDLALSHELHGDLSLAEQMLARARTVEPQTPAVLWHQLNFQLRREENSSALTLARQLLEMAPDYAPRLLPLLARVTDTETLIVRVVPKNAKAHIALLEFLVREARPDVRGAELAWQRVQQQDAAMPQFIVRMFLDWLLQTQQVNQAQRVWNDAAQRGWIPVSPEAARQPFYNADFRFPLLNFGFDWRASPHAEATVWIDPSGPEPGQQSLCVQFTDDARADFANVMRYLPVEPSARYRLRTVVRSDRLNSRAGAFLEVQEQIAASSTIRRLPVRSDSWNGTTHWRPLSLEFATGPETRLVQLALRRPAPRTDEPPAAGAVCLASFELKTL